MAKQPKQCKGCIWGSWDGVKQFCSLQRCVRLEQKREGKNDGKIKISR